MFPYSRDAIIYYSVGPVVTFLHFEHHVLQMQLAIGGPALKVESIFASIYVCESAFSPLKQVKKS